jgi:hypothetical protein
MTRLSKFIRTIVNALDPGLLDPNKSILSITIDWCTAMFAEFVLIVMRRVEQDFAPKLKPMIESMERTGKLPPELKTFTDEMKDPKHPIGALLAGAAGAGVTGGLISSTIGPYLLLLQYENQRLANQARWDPNTGLAVVYRRPDKEELVNSDLRD